MPTFRRKKQNFRARRRKTVRKTRGFRASRAIARPLVTSDRQFVKLKYTSEDSFSGAPGFSLAYRGNGPFDPEVSVGGSQPVGYDEWSALYDRVRVRGCKIRAQIINTSATIPVVAYVVPSRSSVAPTATLASQMVYSKQSFHNVTGGPLGRALVHYMTTNKIAGDRKGIVGFDDIFGSLVTSTPSTQWYWHLVGSSVDSINNAVGCIYVTVTYYCEFYSRKRLAQS